MQLCELLIILCKIIFNSYTCKITFSRAICFLIIRYKHAMSLDHASSDYSQFKVPNKEIYHDVRANIRVYDKSSLFFYKKTLIMSHAYINERFKCYIMLDCGRTSAKGISICIFQIHKVTILRRRRLPLWL